MNDIKKMQDKKEAELQAEVDRALGENDVASALEEAIKKNAEKKKRQEAERLRRNMAITSQLKRR